MNIRERNVFEALYTFSYCSIHKQYSDRKTFFKYLKVRIQSLNQDVTDCYFTLNLLKEKRIDIDSIRAIRELLDTRDRDNVTMAGNMLYNLELKI